MESRKPSDEHQSAIMRPATQLAVLSLLSAAIWTLTPALVHLAPPLDVVEGYMWGREWPLLTYKHPAMPAWAIEASRVLTFGAIGWPVYLASQLFVLATIALVFLLARDLAGDHRALLAAIPLLLFEHLSWRTPEFNHTIAQLPFWVGVALFAWRAATRGTWGAWLLLAVAMAGGMYTKLSHGLIVVVACVWLLYDPRARRQLATPKPWIAAAVALALLVPMAMWLQRYGLQPLDYAQSRAAEPRASAGTFLMRAALIALPMLAVLVGASMAARRDEANEVPPLDHNATAFAATIVAGPLLLSLLAAAVSGSGLRTTWAAPIITLLPLLLVVAVPRFQLPQKGHALASVIAAIMLAIAVGYASRLLIGRVGSDGPTRANWPERQISEAAARAWSSATDKPLRIVAGEAWPAGLAGIRHRDKPSILTSGDLKLSPWIAADQVRRDGVLVVFETGRPMSEALRSLIANRDPKPLDFYGPTRSSGARLSYVVIPPAP